MASLRITNGPRSGETVAVVDELVIGRENADLVLEDTEISRRHAVVRWRALALEIEDLGSSNGTFVDGARIAAPARLRDGSRIKLGVTTFEVEGILAAQETRLGAIADPQVTRARPVGEVPVADPQVTRARPVGEVPVADPQVTRARPVGEVPVADPQVTRARPVGEVPVADPQVTRARPVGEVPVADPQVTRARPASPAASEPVGEFPPAPGRRRQGLASRSWIRLALFGTVVLVAIAVVIYLATR